MARTTSIFRGVSTALVTPFTVGGKEIDYQAWESLIEWQLSCGVQSLTIFGTTGESPTLSNAEKLELTRRTLQIVRKRVPIIAGTGSNDTSKSIELTRAVKEIGVDAALAVVPYYNKPTQEGLYQHFKAIAEQGGLPVYVYNIPGRSVISLSIDTFMRLAQVPNIVGCKQAVDSIAELVELSARCGKDLDILAGDDPLVYSVLSVGGQGVISASASVIPELMVEICEKYWAKDFAGSLAAQQRALPLIKAIFIETNPAPAKAILKMKGIIPEEALRLPLVAVSEATRQKLQEMFA